MEARRRESYSLQEKGGLEGTRVAWGGGETAELLIYFEDELTRCAGCLAGATEVSRWTPEQA